jgi:hypothetical protein
MKLSLFLLYLNVFRSARFIVQQLNMLCYGNYSFQGLKCRSEDEKNNDEFAEIAKMCLSNTSNWDSPRVNTNRDYNYGRRNDSRHYNNRDSYDGNRDSSRDGISNRNNRDYNNYNGGNGNTYGLWRRQQNSGGKFRMCKAL